MESPPPATEPAVRLIPLGGLGEIGLNMMLVESGDDVIAIDCGLMFPDPDEMPGIDHVIPDFSYALAKRDGFRAVFLTHGHEDHIGALSYLLRRAQVPVYGTPLTLALDVHSGFRAPEHNRRVRRAASDSQHQYGDAADVAIDANGDGRITAIDSRMVGLAVEIVELKHPELVGGLGIYTSGHSSTNYVHIDVRGRRARWRGGG